MGDPGHAHAGRVLGRPSRLVVLATVDVVERIIALVEVIIVVVVVVGALAPHVRVRVRAARAGGRGRGRGRGLGLGLRFWLAEHKRRLGLGIRLAQYKWRCTAAGGLASRLGRLRLLTLLVELPLRHLLLRLLPRREHGTAAEV